MRRIVPDTIFPPFAKYSHGVEVPAGARLLVCAGQLGVGKDGHIPDGAEAQAKLCFDNITAILAAAGMTPADVVRINAYVSGRQHLEGYRRARDAFVTGAPPASTLLIVAGFNREEFVVEIEAIAAKAGG